MTDKELDEKIKAARTAASNASSAWRKQNVIYSEDDPGEVINTALNCLILEIKRLRGELAVYQSEERK